MNAHCILLPTRLFANIISLRLCSSINYAVLQCLMFEGQKWKMVVEILWKIRKKPLAIFGHFQLMSNFSEAFTLGGKPLHLKTAPRNEFF